MEILKHRVNNVESIDSRYGAEIDVRDYNGTLVLSHDYPTSTSITLENYLEKFPSNMLLAINVKSCGIEEDLIKILSRISHIQYFVFDFSIPYLLKSLKMNITCACRLSEYEKNIIPGCKWIWLDCFHSIWYDVKYLSSLKQDGFSIALVSPDIHNRNNKEEIEKLKEMIRLNIIDAICTKLPEMWLFDKSNII